MKRTNANLLSFFLLWIIMFNWGCGYDNTLYNARKYFKSAQNKPLNPSGKPTPQAIEDYTKTIKKCGYILTERPKSSQADDALFLLAKSLYYKGNSQFQSLDQFQNLIKNFPGSPYNPESILYIAKIYRQINQPSDAENTLVSYIRNPKTVKWHPGALLLLADFSIQDKDYTKAKFWLERLLSEYPRSVSSREAAFLLGKNYFEQKDYKNSIKQFSQVISTRGIKKESKLDAMYYVAVNQLNLGEIQKSNNSVKKLLKEEIRPEKLPEIRVLAGRLLLELKNEEEALELLQSIIKNNTRSLASAEAYYRLAEYYFYKNKDITNALENYNKVKLESATSPFSEDASNKHKAITQISQSMDLIIDNNPKLYLENRLENADSYYNILHLPDSAFVVFNQISEIPFYLQSKIDSLNLSKQSLQNRLDSLLAFTDTTKTIPDITTPVFNDGDVDTTFIDSTMTQGQRTEIPADSTDIVSEEIINPKPDSIFNEIETNTSLQKTKESNLSTDINNRNEINTLQNDIVKIDLTRENVLNNLKLFKEEYIPYSMFVKATLIYNNDADSLILHEIQQEMNSHYPQNKYTKALKLLLEGKTVRILDMELEKEEEEMDKALTFILSNPDSSTAILRKLTNSKYPDIKTQANFRLGWHFTFEQPDTNEAKIYFKKVIETDRNSDYGILVQRIYNGTNFIIKFENSDSLVTDSTATMINHSEKEMIGPALEEKGTDNYKLDKIDFRFEKPKEFHVPKPY